MTGLPPSQTAATATSWRRFLPPAALTAAWLWFAYVLDDFWVGMHCYGTHKSKELCEQLTQQAHQQILAVAFVGLLLIAKGWYLRVRAIQRGAHVVPAWRSYAAAMALVGVTLLWVL